MAMFVFWKCARFLDFNPKLSGPCWLGPLTQVTTTPTKTNNYCVVILCFFYLAFSIRFCLYECCFVCWRWQLFSVFRGSYKITYLERRDEKNRINKLHKCKIFLNMSNLSYLLQLITSDNLVRDALHFRKHGFRIELIAKLAQSFMIYSFLFK